MRLLLHRIIDRVLCALRAVWFLRAATKRGRGIRMRGRTWLQNDGRILVGDRVGFHAGPVATELTARAGGLLQIGDDTMINYGCSFTASRSIQIGKRCRFGMGVIMTDSHLHREEVERRAERPEPKVILVEDDVWLANRVIVLPGVTLGRGCIVGAGSVVTTSIPPEMLAAGNPARVIRPVATHGGANRESLATTLATYDRHSRMPAPSGTHNRMDGHSDEVVPPASSGLHVKVREGLTVAVEDLEAQAEMPDKVASISSRGRAKSGQTRA